MTRYLLTVTPRGSLFVGGYSQANGEAAAGTARDSEGVLLPGSSVKGALREAAVRLVRASGRGDELLARLFGADDVVGLVRVGLLRAEIAGGAGGEGEPSAEPGSAALLEPSVRHHVSLERATRQAAPQRLFENRVTPAGCGLVFRGELRTPEPLSDDELGLLLCAARITDQVGGGRGRGLGLVRVEIEEAPEAKVEAAPGRPAISSLILALEPAEPVQLAGVKDFTNYTVTKDFLDGSVLRGAVAAALAPVAEEATLESLFGGEQPVVFGDARAGNPCSLPAPMSLVEPKAGGAPFDLAALLCAEAVAARTFARPRDVRTARGTYCCALGGWRKVSVKRRTVTRTARDHASGRAADAKLFSLEVIDPFTEGQELEGTSRLQFFAPVAGTPEQLARVVEAAQGDLFVGADRSRGFGRLRLVSIHARPPLPPLEERHRRWIELLSRLGVERPEATGVLLAVGPLALGQTQLDRALYATGLRIVEGVARRQAHGGWNAAMSMARSVVGCFVPGSTFLVTRRDSASALSALAAVEASGLGPGRPDGWGRLIACHPIHVDCFKEVRSCRP